MKSLEQLPSDFVKTFIRHINMLRFIGLDIFDEGSTNIFKKYARFSFFNALFIPMVVGQVMYITLSKKTGATFLEVANAVPSTFMACQDAVKMCVVVLKRNEIKGVIMGISEIWPTRMQSEEKKKTLKKWLRRLKIIDDVFFSCAIVSVSIFEAAPLFITVHDIHKNPEDYKYLYPLQSYFMCWLKSHFEYALAFFYLFVSSLTTHMALYVSCDFLLVALTFNLSSLLNLLQEDLEEAVANYDENVPESFDNVKSIVARHQKLLWLAEELNNIFGLLIFVQVSFSSVVICCFGFLTVIADGMLLKNLTAVTGIMFAIWNLCWPGQLLADTSFGISEAAYRSEWYNKDIKLRKYIVIIMNRAQKPCYLTALGFSDLTLANFSKILSTSWSYLSLLNTMYQDFEAE